MVGATDAVVGTVLSDVPVVAGAYYFLRPTSFLGMVGLSIPMMLILASAFFFFTPNEPLLTPYEDWEGETYTLEGNTDGTTYTANFSVDGDDRVVNVEVCDSLEYFCDLMYDEEGGLLVRTGSYGMGDAVVDEYSGIVSFSVESNEWGWDSEGVRYPLDPETVGSWNRTDGVFTFDNGDLHHSVKLTIWTVDADLWAEDMQNAEENWADSKRSVGFCLLAPICAVLIMIAGLVVGAASGNWQMGYGGFVGLVLWVIYLFSIALYIQQNILPGIMAN